MRSEISDRYGYEEAMLLSSVIHVQSSVIVINLSPVRVQDNATQVDPNLPKLKVMHPDSTRHEF
jgi:hypothetical protein